jgi:hypothetical protein
MSVWLLRGAEGVGRPSNEMEIMAGSTVGWFAMFQRWLEVRHDVAACEEGSGARPA